MVTMLVTLKDLHGTPSTSQQTSNNGVFMTFPWAISAWVTVASQGSCLDSTKAHTAMEVVENVNGSAQTTPPLKGAVKCLACFTESGASSY